MSGLPICRSILARYFCRQGRCHSKGLRMSSSLLAQHKIITSQVKIPKRLNHDDEVLRAKEAAKTKGQPTIFDKIIDKTIPADIIYEDEKCVAFHDVNPQAPVHMLVIPKTRITMLSESTSEHAPLLGHLLDVARKVADKAELSEGFRIVINNGIHGSQSIYHLHIHVLGGRQMLWPPG